MKAPRITSFFLPLFLFFCVQALSAQTVFIVDAAGGPGSRFKDLPQAVSQAPSGSFLHVRPGNYSSFVVMGKAFRIKGAGPGKTVIQVRNTKPVLAIWNVPGGKTFSLEDLDIKVVTGNPPVTASYLSLINGRFFLGRVRVLSSPGTFPFLQPSLHSPGEVMISGAEVLADHFYVSGGALAFLTNPQGSLPAGLFARNSRLQFTECVIFGSRGGNVDAQKAGTPGIVLVNSVLDLFGGRVLGGSGGDGSKAPGFLPGDGGHGIKLLKGSLVLGEGCQVRGGPNGAYMAGFSGWKVGGMPGVGVSLDSTSGADFHGSDVKGGCFMPLCRSRNSAWVGSGVFKSRPGPVHRPRLSVTHGGPAGRENRLEAEGVPGRLHVLLAGRRSAWIPLGPLGFPGTLQVAPWDFLVLPFRLSSKGTWSLDLPGVTASSLPEPFWLQAFMAPEGDQVISSNAVPLVLWP